MLRGKLPSHPPQILRPRLNVAKAASPQRLNRRPCDLPSLTPLSLPSPRAIVGPGSSSRSRSSSYRILTLPRSLGERMNRDYEAQTRPHRKDIHHVGSSLLPEKTELARESLVIARGTPETNPDNNKDPVPPPCPYCACAVLLNGRAQSEDTCLKPS